MKEMVKDFLRQVVNPTLIEFDIPAQILTEIRKKLEIAENKYDFSAFMGNPKNLVKFFQSPEWKEIVSLFKAAEAEAALIKILERAKEAYKDDEEIVKAIEKALEEVKSGKSEDITNLESLKKRIESVLKDVEVKISGDRVVFESEKLEGYIEEEKGEYLVKIEVRGVKRASNWNEIESLLREAEDLASKLTPP
ncbi:hypothetical protein [Ignicoccus islandicus]|uniref:hypothetical protein n=1 Tax=Ignicoccus islandicus TaxID=54259 RepID=UPI001439E984|nr:hypothetical protein [Ignicoccus islandicus]